MISRTISRMTPALIPMYMEPPFPERFQPFYPDPTPTIDARAVPWT
jgi:hypothetical protein